MLTGKDQLIVVAGLVAITICIFVFMPTTPSASDHLVRVDPIEITSVEYYPMTGCLVTTASGKKYRGNPLVPGMQHKIWWTEYPNHGNVTFEMSNRLNAGLAQYEQSR